MAFLWQTITSGLKQRNDSLRLTGTSDNTWLTGERLLSVQEFEMVVQPTLSPLIFRGMQIIHHTKNLPKLVSSALVCRSGT